VNPREVPLLYLPNRVAATFSAPHPMSLILNLLAIIVCGGCGALLAWLLVSMLGWTGVAGVLAAAVVGMLAATLFWAAGVALLRVLGWLR
jgi:hypothetical protein